MLIPYSNTYIKVSWFFWWYTHFILQHILRTYELHDCGLSS